MAEDTVPEEGRPDIDKLTGIQYSHDYRIIKDALENPLRGGSIFRYRWERRGTPKSGSSVVWVRGGLPELMNLFRSWEMRGSYVYTYLGEGIREAQTAAD